MGTRTCPKCSAEMEYVESEPDVGIHGDMYVCTNEKCCNVVERDDDDESDYMDDAARDEANHRSGS